MQLNNGKCPGSGPSIYNQVNKNVFLGFPSDSDSNESACNAGELGSIPGSGWLPGGRHGNPLQYSCLENPMDRGAWCATVHVTKSWHDCAANTHKWKCTGGLLCPDVIVSARGGEGGRTLLCGKQKCPLSASLGTGKSWDEKCRWEKGASDWGRKKLLLSLPWVGEGKLFLQRSK